MASGVRNWNCENCGKANEAAGPDGAVTCAYCTETARLPPVAEAPAGDHKRQVFARLRQRYIEARGLVSMTEPYANLEWILGEQRNFDRDESRLDSGVAELVVLWMQDLATELADSSVPARPGAADDDVAPMQRSRLAMAQGLRFAAQEFAVAFRDPS
jgi:hypothetical protein